MVRIKAEKKDSSEFGWWHKCDEWINPTQIFCIKKDLNTFWYSKKVGTEVKKVKTGTWLSGLLLNKKPKITEIKVPVYEQVEGATYYLKLSFAVASGGGHRGNSSYSSGPTIKTVEYRFETEKERDEVFNKIIGEPK